MHQLPDFRLEVFFSRWEFAARHVLTASDAQSMTLGELLALGTDEDRAAFERITLGYVPTWGGDGLRQAIAGTYVSLRPEDVLAFAGAQEALFWLFQDSAGPGDHVLLTVPGYQSIESLALATGAEVTGLALEPENGWALDLDRLERALRPSTRLVAVNFPHNPSGAVPDPSTFQALVDLCEARGIRLFCDEVHRGLELDPARRLTQAADLSPTAVSLNVTSKSYGLAGLRVGWLASRDRALLARLERRKHYTSISNSGPERVPGRPGAPARRGHPGPEPRDRPAQPAPLRRLLRAVGGALRLGAPPGRLHLLSPLQGCRGRGGLLPGSGGTGGRPPRPRQPLPLQPRGYAHRPLPPGGGPVESRAGAGGDAAIPGAPKPDWTRPVHRPRTISRTRSRLAPSRCPSSRPRSRRRSSRSSPSLP